MSTSIPNPGISLRSRFLGAWWGLFIGDALAMPVDGYYNVDWLKRDYGRITRYVALKEPHPNCEMPRVQFRPSNERDNILHHRAKLWEKPGTHYHHGLEPGDITLPAIIARTLAESLRDNAGKYSMDDFVKRYLELMLKPEGHRDTYIASAHRRFFRNYGSGKPIERCGENDTHIAGLLEAAPLMLSYCGAVPEVSRVLRQHISLLRPSSSVVLCGDLLAQLLALLFQGVSLDDAIYKNLGHLHHPFLAYPYHRWIAHQTDQAVATQQLSQGPLVDDAIPLVFYLALKYSHETEKALEMNAVLGGDACHRGALIGMLLGAQNGCESIPGELATGLRDFDALDALGDAMWNLWKERPQTQSLVKERG